MPTETFLRLDREKRDKISRCATQNFAEKGYTGTSMDAVAEAAGVAKGALYRYFTSKKDMYMHVVDILRDDAREFVEEFLEERREQSIFETIRDWLVSIHLIHDRLAVHHNVLCNVLYQESVDFKGEVLAKFGKLSTQYYRQILQQGIARGEVREDLDIDAAAFVVQSVQDRFHDGATMPYLDMGFALYQQPQAVIENKADHIIDIFHRAFGKTEGTFERKKSGMQNHRSESA